MAEGIEALVVAAIRARIYRANVAGVDREFGKQTALYRDLARTDLPAVLDVLAVRDAQIERVRAIHREKHGYDTERDEEYTVCEGCSASPYPCRTIRALDGAS